MYSGSKLDEICAMQNKNIEDKCFHVEEVKTEAAARVIPVHPLIESIIHNLKSSSKDKFMIKVINSDGYNSKRSWNFEKQLERLRNKIGIPKG